MSNIIQQNITPKSKKHGHQKKVLKIAVILGAMAILALGGYLAWQWWPRENKPEELTQQTYEEYKQASDKTYIKDLATIPKDASKESKATQLRILANVHLSKKQYNEAESTTKEILALPGYDQDVISLILLADVYKAMNKTTDEKKVAQQALTALKSQTGSDIDTTPLQEELKARIAQ